jgi:hypothetical protein
MIEQGKGTLGNIEEDIKKRRTMYRDLNIKNNVSQKFQCVEDLIEKL